MSQTITRCDVGHRGVKFMPYSEACMFMRLSGKRMGFEVLGQGMVQLYTLDELGLITTEKYSFPITEGEAGIFRDREGRYYYPYNEAG